LKSGQQQYALHGGADQPSCLELVETPERRGAGGHERADVDVLPADHPVHAGGGGQLRHRGEDGGGLARLLTQDEPEGLRVEAVAGEDGDVLAELDVAGRAAAGQLVVVHRGEVLVNEGVRVDELERGGEREHGGGVAAGGAGRGEREHGTDALAAGQQRV